MTHTLISTCFNVYEGNIDDYLNPKFGIFEYLMEQKNGRIRHLGFSAHGSIEAIRRFLDAYGEQMEFGQPQLYGLAFSEGKGRRNFFKIRRANMVMEFLRRKTESR
ncbi:MAG: hypothetical protein ACLVJO_04790 [[Clostridium] scindens]